MKAANLSIVIAPNILRPREETMQSTVGDAGHQLKTIALAIERHVDVFGKTVADTVYGKYIGAWVKHLSGDTKVDCSDLIAWQKDYNVCVLMCHMSCVMVHLVLDLDLGFWVGVD